MVQFLRSGRRELSNRRTTTSVGLAASVQAVEGLLTAVPK